MLQMTVAKKINAHDILLSANILNLDGYVVFPRISMSNHIGFGDGVHCTVEIKDYASQLSQTQLVIDNSDVKEDPAIVESLHYWFLKVHIKLLCKYLFSLGPLKNIFKRRKTRE
jgi:hypothetical protein